MLKWVSKTKMSNVTEVCHLCERGVEQTQAVPTESGLQGYCSVCASYLHVRDVLKEARLSESERLAVQLQLADLYTFLRERVPKQN